MRSHNPVTDRFQQTPGPRPPRLLDRPNAKILQTSMEAVSVRDTGANVSGCEGPIDALRHAFVRSARSDQSLAPTRAMLVDHGQTSQRACLGAPPRTRERGPQFPLQ